MPERRDDELGELLREARPEPREGWRERTLARILGARKSTWGSRLRWVPTVLGTALVIAALALVPYSAGTPGGGGQAAFAAQEALAAAAGGEVPEAGAGGGGERDDLSGPLGEYADRAPAFVRERYPDDPEMLIAAGLLTRDLHQARAMLKSAVEKGGSGAAWAAYAQVVMESGPTYDQPGTWAVDPADPESIADFEQRTAEPGVPRMLASGEAKPVLDVLREWQQVEPENAVPFALETYYLYGLHRDEDALARWEQAGALPDVDSHAQEFIWYTARLLEAMGMSPWESASNSFNTGTSIGSLSMPRTCARIGVYEGRLAEMEGRDQEAVRWWLATFRFGEHMQESADTLIETLIGIAIEGIGGSPVWIWHSDRMTGTPDGPLQGGRLWRGKSHELFIEEAGQEVVDEIRDSMVKAKARSMLAREYVKTRGLPPPLMEGMIVRGFAGILVGLLVAALIGFGVVSLWARRRADEATRLGWRGRVALALIALAPLAVGFALSWRATATDPVRSGVGLVVGVGVSFLLLLAAPLAAAFRSRASGAGVLSAWRGNLRKVLPIAVVALAVASLGFAMAGRSIDEGWVRDWASETEMERVKRMVGPEWDDPTIPPDAWRNEPSPEAKGG